MKREQVRPPQKTSSEDVFDQFYDLQSVVSAQGMTGLTPDLPQTNEELDAYSNLQGIPKMP